MELVHFHILFTPCCLIKYKCLSYGKHGTLFSSKKHSHVSDILHRHNPDISVDIKKGHTLVGGEFQFPAEANDFSLLHNVQTSSGAQTLSYLTGTENISLGINQFGSETDHLPPPSAEIKTGGVILPFPIRFRGV
jgi:hypothetical protein